MSKRTQAEQIIHNSMLWSFGGGFIPIPLADIMAVTALQVEMLSKLSRLYDAEFSQDMGKHFVSGLVGSTVAKFGASFLKTVPVFGSLAGGAAMAVMSAASTYAVGQVALAQFESEGHLTDVDDEARQAYKEAYKEGEAVAKEMQEERQEA